ncbi:MAG: hypothetical protein HYX27_27610 [Acidobacteria bacterium]|nr:hypothetical protein [Acidobacteriota bacterium]
MLDDVQPAPFTVPFGRIREVLGDSLAPTVVYPVASCPFLMDATLSEWLVSPDEIRIVIATGTLIDLDKGSFSLSGLGVNLRAEGSVVPIGMVSPGDLSELQQAVVLDAITTYLNQPGLSYRADSTGLHVTAGDRTFHFSPKGEQC